MLISSIARRSRRQVPAGLLSYAVACGHVFYATPRIDLYQRRARLRRRSIPFAMPLSSPHPPSSFSFFLSTCHSLHCAAILLMFNFPFMYVPRLRARSTSMTGPVAQSALKCQVRAHAMLPRLPATLAMLPVTCGGVHHATMTRNYRGPKNYGEPTSRPQLPDTWLPVDR
jgi:hypothetical protein